MDAQEEPRPRVLVLGGGGAIGAGVIERAHALGFPVTAVGRRPAPPDRLRRALLDPAGIPWRTLDLADAGCEAPLADLLQRHDLVVLACEPWRADDARGDPTAAARRLYRLAARAGFTQDANRERSARGCARRRLVRVGSSAAELPHALLDREAPGFAEDRVSRDALEALARREPCWQNHYFQAKVALARAADDAARAGVDLVCALPTYCVSAWGERGEQEPLVQAWRLARRLGVVPAVPIDAVPVDVAATGILLAGLAGRAGERYQVAGVETDTHAMHALSLRHVGLEPRPWPVPTAELRDEVRLLGGRPRHSPWLDLWLLPWDAWRRAALRARAVEAWHVALMLEGSRRSARKLRALATAPSRVDPDLCYPPEPVIRRRLAAEARRKMEWLARPGPYANPGSHRPTRVA